MNYLLETDGGGLFGVLFGGMGLLICLVMYVVVSLPLYLIAQKLGNDSPWMAFIPIANLFLLCSLAGKEWWYVLLLLIPLINLVILAILYMGLAENLGHPAWVG